MTIKWAGPWVARSANCCGIDQGVTLQGEWTILTPLQSAVLRLHISVHMKNSKLQYTQAARAIAKVAFGWWCKVGFLCDCNAS